MAKEQVAVLEVGEPLDPHVGKAHLVENGPAGYL